MMLAMFAMAMVGPMNPKDFNGQDFTGCKRSRWISTSCYQRPSEQEKCTTADSGDVYDCRGVLPGFLAFDYNRDLVVDLLDFQILQNTWPNIPQRGD